MFAAIVALASTSHVAMRYVDGQPGPIRNAGSPTGNGRGSVAGACGGGAAFGANGIGTISDGETVTLNINYAAGHRSAQNAFRMAYTCGDTSQNGVEAAPALTAAANGCTATAAGQAATYGPNGVPAPDAIVPGGYSVTCTLPLQNVAASTECTMSLLDQRDWGGCVDVNVLPADASVPPAPPPAPLVPNAGSYQFSRARMVDTSAATFNCCPLESGYIEVPPTAPGAPSFQGTVVNARASSCRTSSLETAPETATHDINEPVTFTLAGGSGNRYVSTTLLGGAWAGQPFEISIENGLLDFQNVGADQPILCDGFSSLDAPAGGGGGIGGGGGSLTGGSSGDPTVAILALIVVVLLVGGGCYAYRRRQSAPLPPPKFSNAINAPPPPPASGLPAGWVEMADPTSGSKYYYNQGTGETTWSRPGGGVA